MAKRVSSAAIGGFVLASLALAIVAALVLGSGKLLRRPHYFICMFNGSLNGLKVGAAIKIRGVQIGTVKQISLNLHPGEGELRQISVSRRPMPVLIELDEREFRARGGKSMALGQEEIDKLVKAGLRAQLQMEKPADGSALHRPRFSPQRAAQSLCRTRQQPIPRNSHDSNPAGGNTAGRGQSRSKNRDD